MAATSIQWCDHSINPIRATLRSTGKVGHYCEKIAAGCRFCYSSELQRRFGTPEFGGGQNLDLFDIWLDESKLEEVRRRKKPTRYFWCDMTDLFGHWVKQEWLTKCFAAMDATPQHTHILLTKRPENIRRMWPGDQCGDCYEAEQRGVECSPCEGTGTIQSQRSNVWLLTSVSDQATADAAIPELLKCRDLAPVLGVSYEPALGPVTFDTLGRAGPPRWLVGESDHNDPTLDWIIYGGESGHNARPCDVAWARSTVEQCRAAGVPCFVKQMGAHVVIRNDGFSEWPNGGDNLRDLDESWQGRPTFQGDDAHVRLADKKGGDLDELPPDMRVRQFPSMEAIAHA